MTGQHWQALTERNFLFVDYLYFPVVLYTDVVQPSHPEPFDCFFLCNDLLNGNYLVWILSVDSSSNSFSSCILVELGRNCASQKQVNFPRMSAGGGNENTSALFDGKN